MSCGSNLDKKLTKPVRELLEKAKASYDASSSKNQEKARESCKKTCESYMETDSYNNGETDTFGYFQCCDIFGFCGGTSGWVIFLIILIVIGCLAAAGAAFWFFYWKRKMGGRDEEKEVESGEDTTKRGYDISVDTY